MKAQSTNRWHRPVATRTAIGLALVALVAWLLIGFIGNGRTTDDLNATPGGMQTSAALADTIAGAPSAINDYLQFAALPRATNANRSHDYTADGVRRLAGALSALLQWDGGTGASRRLQIESLRRRADDLQRNPGSLRHAEYARDAFTTAASVSQWFQERNVPAAADAVKQVRAAALDIDPSLPLLQQTAKVQRYFDLAGTAVRILMTRVADGGRAT
jgi:hypothetical protein